MSTTIKSKWFQLASKYSEDSELNDSLWKEIEKQYSLKIRHYHNLSHINNMLNHAQIIKNAIDNYDDFMFSIWYHDIIYNPTKKDNEQKSAVLAKERLKHLNINKARLNHIEKLIVSTQKHEIILSNNKDNAYLLDIDLSILGSDWETYLNYTKSIRNEYAIYPNFIYKKGRKNVLNHFLKRKTLYFTKPYQNKYEKKARQNLLKEISLL